MAYSLSVPFSCQGGAWARPWPRAGSAYPPPPFFFFFFWVVGGSCPQRHASYSSAWSAIVSQLCTTQICPRGASYDRDRLHSRPSARWTTKSLLLFGGGLLGLLAAVFLADGSMLRRATSSASFHNAPPSAPDLAAFFRSSAASSARAFAFFGSRSAAAAATRVAATTSVVIGFWASFFAPFTTFCTFPSDLFGGFLVALAAFVLAAALAAGRGALADRGLLRLFLRHHNSVPSLKRNGYIVTRL